MKISHEALIPEVWKSMKIYSLKEEFANIWFLPSMYVLVGHMIIVITSYSTNCKAKSQVYIFIIDFVLITWDNSGVSRLSASKMNVLPSHSTQSLIPVGLGWLKRAGEAITNHCNKKFIFWNKNLTDKNNDMESTLTKK